MTDWENYESGPFCRHWYDPAECEEKCANCGHRCFSHGYGSDSGCNECDCQEWKDAN